MDVLDHLPSANVFDDENALKLLKENHVHGRSPGCPDAHPSRRSQGGLNRMV